MIRLSVIGLSAVAWLAVVAALIALAGPAAVPDQRWTGRSIALADLIVGGVPAQIERNAQATAGRDPFGFAPTFRQEAYASVADTPVKRGLLAAFDMTLEGVLVRGGKYTAFVSYQGQRRPLRTGDRIGDQLVVAHIEQDRIQVVGNGNESRWIYLTQ